MTARTDEKIAAYHAGDSLRAVAERFHVSKAAVSLALKRADARLPERVWRERWRAARWGR